MVCRQRVTKPELHVHCMAAMQSGTDQQTAKRKGDSEIARFRHAAPGLVGGMFSSIGFGLVRGVGVAIVVGV